MIRNPYEVLGVSQNATPEEIKKAYRKKVKQYHPDLHPGDATATQKMNEVNEAYDMLTNPEKYRRAQQNTYSGGAGNYGQGGYGQYGNFEGFDFEDIFRGFYTMHRIEPLSSDSPTVAGAVRAVNSGQYAAALQILNSVEAARRNARWYYVSAIAHRGMGHTMEALSHIGKAMELEPNNPTYRRTWQEMQYTGQSYRQNGGYSVEMTDWSKCCTGLCIANLFCPFCRCWC